MRCTRKGQGPQHKSISKIKAQLSKVQGALEQLTDKPEAVQPHQAEAAEPMSSQMMEKKGEQSHSTSAGTGTPDPLQEAFGSLLHAKDVLSLTGGDTG